MFCNMLKSTSALTLKANSSYPVHIGKCFSLTSYKVFQECSQLKLSSKVDLIFFETL